MSRPRACAGCLQRSWLLGRLGPYIEPISLGPSATNLRALLALPSDQLVRAIVPDAPRSVLERNRAATDGYFAEALDAAGCWAVCRHHELFPLGLRGLAGAPPALICRGDVGVVANLKPYRTVTVVGAREPTAYGMEISSWLAGDLVRAGMTVIAGLAPGIAAAVHRGALEAGGSTVAVMPCGCDVPYPEGHRDLWDQINASGALVSELPPGAPAGRWTFAARNRILAGLGGMTVVIEGRARSSALVTADLADDAGRQIGAVPGPVNSEASAGPNDLLGAGACLIQNAGDVVDCIAGARRARVSRERGRASEGDPGRRRQAAID